MRPLELIGHPSALSEYNARRTLVAFAKQLFVPPGRSRAFSQSLQGRIVTAVWLPQ
jgi:hypothetical protein